MFNVCAKCKSTKISVINSRERKDYIFRRRRCDDCGEKFTTREIRQTEFEALQKERAQTSPEKQLRAVVRAYVLTLSAKEQVEFFDEIIK